MIKPELLAQIKKLKRQCNILLAFEDDEIAMNTVHKHLAENEMYLLDSAFEKLEDKFAVEEKLLHELCASVVAPSPFKP